MNIYQNTKLQFNHGLTNEQLLSKASSVFAENGSTSTSSRYAHIPTIKVIEALRAHNWMPVNASEIKSRVDDKKGFTKHLVRFRNASDFTRQLSVNDNLHEIVLLNSHDGTSSYQLHSGIFRLICSNGLIVSDSTIEKQTVKHSGNVIDNVIEGVYSIVENSRNVYDKIEAYKGIQLSTDASRVLAESAAIIKWGDDKNEWPVEPSKLLNVRRTLDKGEDLWSKFNVIQENLMRGGLRYITRKDNKVTRGKTREVKSISENVKLNKALWHLADNMAQLVTA